MNDKFYLKEKASLRTWLIFPNGESLFLGEEHNIIVTAALGIITGLLIMKTPFNGLNWLAVGGGDPLWPDPPPEAGLADVALLDEIDRMELTPGDVWEWVDDMGVPSLVPTKNIRLTVLIPEGVGTGVIREMALFGGDATAVKDSGIMFNAIRHKPIDKLANVALKRQLTIELSLA